MNATRLCKIDGCEKPSKGARSYCGMHQTRITRHGDPHVAKNPGPYGWTREEFLERYIPHRPDGECWIWQGYLNNQGYGVITQTVEEGRQRPYKGHRYVYEMLVGPIPEGMLLRHSCDNPPCVNPQHLTPGTHAENARDAVERGRVARGGRNGTASLTEDDVRSIMRRAEAGERKGAIAKSFGISPSGVSGILHGRNWNHVTGICQTRPDRECYCGRDDCKRKA